MEDLALKMDELSIKMDGMAPKPTIRIDLFKGHRDQRTFSSFIGEFNKLATAYSWQNAEMCKMLPIFLSKEAQIIYDGLTRQQKENWPTLIDQLAQKFAIGAGVTHYRRMCQTRKQRPGESIPIFSEVIGQLVEKGYPDGAGFNAQIRKDLAIDLFINGLKINLREQLRHKPKPTTLHQAIQEAIEEEEAQGELAREKLANSQVEAVNQLGSQPPISQNWVQTRPSPNQNFGNNEFRRPFRGGFFRGGRNWNQRAPFNQQYNRPTPYFQRNRFSQNRERNNPNFEPVRNRFVRRGRGRGGYKINTLETRTNSRSLSPLWSIVTVVTMINLFLPKTTLAYQICPDIGKNTLLAPPEKTNCTLPDEQSVIGEYEVEIFVPRTRPLIFQGFSCQKKIIGASTYSFLKMFNSKMIFPDKLEGIPPEECWKLAKKGKLGKKELVRVDENTLRSYTDLELIWGILGTEYFYEFDYVVTIGMVYVNYENKIVKSELGLFGNCSLEEKVCENDNATLIWDDTADFHCPYETAGTYRGIISNSYVLVENLQAAFIFADFSNGNISDVNILKCFRANTFAMENDVFIAIPGMDRFLTNRKNEKVRIPIRLDIDYDYEEEPRRKRYIPELKRPRKMNVVENLRTTPKSPTSPTVPPVTTTIDKSTTTTTKKPTTTTTEKPTTTTTKKPTTTITEKPTTTTTKKPTTTITEKPTTTTTKKPTTTTTEKPTTTTTKKHTTTAEKSTTVTTSKPTTQTLKTSRTVAMRIRNTPGWYTTHKTTSFRLATPKTITTTPKTTRTVPMTTTTKIYTIASSSPKYVQTTQRPYWQTKQYIPIMTPTPRGSERRWEITTPKGPVSQREPNTKDHESQVTRKTVGNSIERFTSTPGKLSERIADNPTTIAKKLRQRQKVEKYQREAQNMIKKIANTFGIKIRREAPWNSDFTTPPGIQDKQTNNNLNTRLQFLEVHTRGLVQKNFNRLWALICDLHNRQVDTVKSILAMNPTLGTRLWLRKHEISAKFVGEAISVSKCHQLVPKKIFWSHEINGTCYEKVPVQIAENEKVLFLVSGSQAQDLEASSKEISCSERPISVFKDDQGIWQTFEGPTSVENFPNTLPYKPEKARAIFRAETIFQSDLNSLMSSVSIMHSYANRINQKERVIREQNITHGESINIWTEMSRIAKEKGQNLTESVKMIVSNPWSFLLGDMKFYFIVIAVVVSIFSIIVAGIYFYPWIEPLLRVRSKRMRRAPKRRAPDPPTEEWEEMEPQPKIKRRAPEPPRGKGIEINQLMPEPSAPSELELGTFVHTLIPKIYQISIHQFQQKDTQPYLPVEINGLTFKALLDTGASVSYCKVSVGKLIGNFCFDLGFQTHAKVANGNSFQFLAKIKANLRLKDVEVPMTILVSKDEHCPTEILLGTDFMKLLSNLGYEVSFDWQNKSIKLNQVDGAFQNPIPMIANLDLKEEYKAKLKEKCFLEPHTDNFLPVNIAEGTNPNPVLISQGNIEVRDCVMIGKTVCNAEAPFVRILNVGNDRITFYPGQTVAKWEPINQETQCETVFEININHEEATPEETPELDITANFPESTQKSELLSNLNLDESCLSEIAKIELRKIILRHQEAFVGSDGRIGHFTGPIKHRIDLMDEKKVTQQRPYRVPPQLREEIHKQIHELLRQNIIRESNSAFSSPIVLVKKKDGTYRFAIDYRQLNQNTKKSCYFLPLIQDILDEVGGKAIFSSFDFMSGFFQIGIEETHIERTAFATFCGIFEFLRMPMGLCGAPCTFQKIMESLRKELGNGVLCYLDDLIIASIDEATHLRDLENLLRVLKKYNLKLRLDKCVFGRSEIKYLGFLISTQGIRPDPKNVAAVQRFEPPKTLNQLRSFIGCVSYFRRFIKNFATIISPLNELTKSEKPIEKVWDEGHQKSFNEIKKKLLSAPVLAPPKFNQSFIIETDASKVAIAACLLQKGEDGEHPISYISRKLNPAEQRYITAEIEGLAIIYALKQYRPYIEGSKTTLVRTDNSVACSLLKKRDLIGRMAKYQIALQEYNIKIEHRSGKSNKFCDYMSRFPGQEDSEAKCAVVEIEWEKFGSEMRKGNEEIQDFELPKELHYPSEKFAVVTLDEIRKEIDRDKAYKKVIDILGKENIPENEQQQEEFLQEVENTHEKFSFIDGILYRWVEIGQNSHPAIVIPYVLRERITRECHEDEMLGAHLGIVKTIEKMRKRFWWKNLIKDVKLQLNACTKCQQRKSHPKDVFKEPLNPIPVPKIPMERVHIDILGPLPTTEEGHKYILTITDSFSKWLSVMPMRDQTAQTVSKLFVDQFLTKFGTPKYLISDNGKQFVSKIFDDLAKIYHFKHNRTTVYRPQANGAVERMNKVVADMLFSYVNTKGDNWSDFLQIVALAYNTSIHSSTGKTPFYLLFWREPILPIDLRLQRDQTQQSERDFNLSEFAQAYTKEIAEIVEKVRDTMTRAQEKQKEFADIARNAREHDFYLGELVMKKIDHWQAENYHKFRPKWSGPWKIVDIRGPVLTIKNLGTPEKTIKVNKEKVKRFIRNFQRKETVEEKEE